MRKLLGVVAAALLLFAAGAAAQTIDQVLAQTGLDRDLVTLLTVEQGGQKLLLVFVYINERTLHSNVKPEIAQQLSSYVGKNAVLIWAYSETGAKFDPASIWFSQGDSKVTLSSENVTPLEGDLLAGTVPAATPVAAVVVLGSAIDPAQPFEVHYGNLALATLAVNMGGAQAQAAAQASAQAQSQAQASAQGQAQASSQVSASAQVQVSSQTEVGTTGQGCCGCGQETSSTPCGCDPCAWLSSWWSGCCGEATTNDCCCPGLIPFLLLLLLGH